MTIAITVLIIIILLQIAGYYFARLIIYPKIYPFEETYRLGIEWGHIVEEDYKRWAAEEISIPSPHGYNLFAIYHPVAGSNKTLVISHGITWSLYGMIKYAQPFYRRGWNILVYDLRNHGRSGGKDTTFGHYEKHDLKTVVDWAFNRLGPGGIVGTMGESLGAAITLQHAAIDPRISFAVADCAFSDLDALLSYRLKVEYHLPKYPLIPLAEMYVRMLTGMYFDSASPIRYLPQIETPIFFVHGQDDKYIPPQMSIDMYNAKTKGIRKLYLAPNAAHAQSFFNNRAAYDEQIGEFLDEIGELAKIEKAQTTL